MTQNPVSCSYQQTSLLCSINFPHKSSSPALRLLILVPCLSLLCLYLRSSLISKGVEFRIVCCHNNFLETVYWKLSTTVTKSFCYEIIENKLNATTMAKPFLAQEKRGLHKYIARFPTKKI